MTDMRKVSKIQRKDQIYKKAKLYIRNNIIYVSMLGNNSIGIIREMSGHKKCCN